MDIFFSYTIQTKDYRGCCRVGSFPAPEGLSPFLPPDCETLSLLARRRLRKSSAELGIPARLHNCCVSSSGPRTFTDRDICRVLEASGVRPRKRPALHSGSKWYECTPGTMRLAMIAASRGEKTIVPERTAPTETAKKDKKPRDVRSVKPRQSASPRPGHGTASALDWDEAMDLVRKTYFDGRYTESMLLATGCYLGLRISDILRLKWSDVCTTENISIKEKKTGKLRNLRVNNSLRQHALRCRENLAPDSDDEYIFRSYAREDGEPISRQRAAQMLDSIKARYDVRTAETFSTHSLRKTFGRRVWLVECARGRGDQALLLLRDAFGHSDTNITKRYLGIRQEEVLSLYDRIIEEQKNTTHEIQHP